MKEIDSLNIPAFKRKRSLAAKARKKPSYEKLIPKRPSRKVAPKSTIMTRERYPSDLLLEDVLTDIPAHEHSHTIDEFPEPQVQPYNPSPGNLREMKLIGRCDGYFDKINVAIVKLTSPVREGDQIIFEKEGGLFEQPIDSMQIDRKDIKIAHSGDDIGLKTAIKPKVGGLVYKIL